MRNIPLLSLNLKTCCLILLSFSLSPVRTTILVYLFFDESIAARFLIASGALAISVAVDSGRCSIFRGRGGGTKVGERETLPKPLVSAVISSS